MKILANKRIKTLFLRITWSVLAFTLLSAFFVALDLKDGAIYALLCSVAMGIAVLAACFLYFREQNKIMEDAVAQITEYISGNHEARIECDEEGELYRLFHEVNSLAAILNAHAEKEGKSKQFLKDTISNISHQLKTPLSALNIYNGLLQEEPENVADMIKDVELHFAYRAGQEQKEILLSGDDSTSLICDRDWMMEAIGNIVKNALDHTKSGDHISIEWKSFPSVVQIQIKDNGSGIHPEDLHHIFKRFYRSRFSKDIQGVGLGLPLAKAIIEAHDGTIEVDSRLGNGTTFLLNFLIPTKL